MVAIKWEDCRELPHLHIVREEIRNQETNQYEAVEHTKTNRDCFVVLIPKAVSILEKIPKQGKRTKSTHKMSKSYASNLSANGVPLDCIREMLGHSSNLSTTLEYIYNPLTEKETYDLITKTL